MKTVGNADSSPSKTLTVPYKTLTVSDFIIISFILFLYGALNISFFTSNHVWGPDFAQYIRHALNIIDGLPYHTLIVIDEEIVPIRRNYPPGFPLLIAPIILFFGVDLYAMKFLILLSTMCVSVCCFIYLREYFSKPQAYLGFVIVLVVPGVLRFQQILYSDLSFTAVCYLAMLTFRHWEKHRSWIWIGVFIMLCVFSYFIRTVGVTLFVASALYLIICHKKVVESALLITALLLSVLFQQYIGASTMGYIREFELPDLGFQFFFSEFGYTLGKLSQVFLQAPDFVIHKKTLGVYGAAVVLSILVMYLFLAYWKFPLSSLLRRITLLDVFFAVYVVAITTWQAFSAKVGTPRFFFPLILPFLFYCFYVWNNLIDMAIRRGKFVRARWVTRTALLIVIVYYTVETAYVIYDPPRQDAFSASTVEAYDAVGRLTERRDTVAFFKPALMSFATERKSFRIGSKIPTAVDRFWLGENPNLAHGSVWLLERREEERGEEMSVEYFRKNVFRRWESCLRWQNNNFLLYEFRASTC